jgi:hypothetical protein
MKVFVQVIDTHSSISQYGMIEESIQKGFEVANALEQFGVNINTVEWVHEYSKNNFITKTGEVRGTTKIVNVTTIKVVSDQPLQ